MVWNTNLKYSLSIVDLQTILYSKDFAVFIDIHCLITFINTRIELLYPQSSLGARNQKASRDELLDLVFPGGWVFLMSIVRLLLLVLILVFLYPFFLSDPIPYLKYWCLHTSKVICIYAVPPYCITIGIGLRIFEKFFNVIISSNSSHLRLVFFLVRYYNLCLIWSFLEV